MSHLSDEFELPRSKHVSISNIGKIEKLEKMEQEQLELLHQFEDAIEETKECYNWHLHAVRHRRSTKVNIGKIQRKLKNLRKVKDQSWELNRWYTSREPHHNNRFTYPVKVTPAGRVRVIKISHGETYTRWNHEYRGPFWCIEETYVESQFLEKASRLTAVVQHGKSLDRVRELWEQSTKRKSNKSYCSIVYAKDIEGMPGLEILESY